MTCVIFEHLHKLYGILCHDRLCSPLQVRRRQLRGIILTHDLRLFKKATMTNKHIFRANKRGGFLVRSRFLTDFESKIMNSDNPP